MGSFFTNVQVRTDEAGRAALVDALRESLEAEGLEAVPAESPLEPDRTIVIRPVDAGGWVAVYDSRSEAQDPATLDALATVATEATGGAAFWALVYDSDVLALGLFVAGVRRDGFDSSPGYFGEAVPAEQREALAGDAAAWAEALGVDEAAVAEVLGREDAFAEETLQRLAELLGVEPGRAGVGLRYLGEVEREDAANVVLRFRARERPAWEAGAEGPVALGPRPGFEAPLVAAVGDPLLATLPTANQGGAGVGLRAIVYGSALERGLLEVEALELVVGSPRDAGFERVARTPEPIASEGGRRGLLAEWRRQPIPAGPGAAQPSDAADWPAFLQAQQRAALHLSVRGRVVGAGEGSLVVLLESPAEPPSQVAARYRVRVDAPLWEPLRFAPPPTPMSPRSMLLRRLSGERHRVLLAALSPEARERVSADALERFGGLLERASLDGGLTVSAIWADPSRRPKVSQHRRWPIRGLAKKLAQCAELSVEARAEAEGDANAPLTSEQLVQRVAEGVGGSRARATLALGSGMPFGGAPAEERAWVLGVSVGAGALPAAHAALEAWLDALAADEALLQATLSPAGWAPNATLASTPYEQACGIHQGGCDRAYCARWLRWPGRDRLVLGAGLFAELDREALEAVAEVEARALGGARVTKREGVTRSAWEEALAPILPSAEDARASRGRVG
ncbi:MAG TPA: hypothetical protein RMI29_16410 [Polyangiaceae bacterium LLY-WYZ-15_(1-7)]|nr:hypothetical protein [Myxococcales bacterium]MAT28810.1 hypothetical protein [Sandaracinus sp.]HJL03006.1 hypothetical protein [Polyangiaceae bacterium LLY-WYZ-15_(1-7)]HJL22672.1 hypothetical protein [Polyangiaceae bacterium LLY-WYZ-15_(1-7)]